MDDEPINNASTKSYKPMIAGILLILAGLLGIITWISYLLIDFTTIDPSILDQLQQSGMEITVEQIDAILSFCATIGIILSIFPLLGGILALKRKMWGISIVMCIIALFTVGPIFASSILALVGLILIAISKNEFQRKSEKELPIDEYSYLIFYFSSSICLISRNMCGFFTRNVRNKDKMENIVIDKNLAI